MKKPILSVCMVTYNNEKYIQAALNSIISQVTNFTIEILISDDCSTDRTVDIIREYYIKDCRVKLLVRKKMLV